MSLGNQLSGTAYQTGHDTPCGHEAAKSIEYSLDTCIGQGTRERFCDVLCPQSMPESKDSTGLQNGIGLVHTADNNNAPLMTVLAK